MRVGSKCRRMASKYDRHAIMKREEKRPAPHFPASNGNIIVIVCEIICTLAAESEARRDGVGPYAGIYL